ncbi:hypothetical protein JXA02_14600 [candidate division KSB1 bacterium]|nr:hypothetical protein [candidate division KSB1 bacterium]
MPDKTPHHLHALSLKSCVTMFILLFLALPLRGQLRTVTHSILTQELVRQGYEDVIARTSERVTLVHYADARNRRPLDGLQEVVGRTCLLLPPANEKVVIVLAKYGVPLLVFENDGFAPYYNPRRHKNMRIPRLTLSDRPDTITSGLSIYPEHNKSSWKTDLIFHPDLRMRFGNYNHPIQSQLNIIPEFQTTLWPGLFLSASFVLPVHNDFAEWENYNRLGPTSLNYVRRLRNSSFLYATTGYFRGNRYGGELGWKKYLLAGLFALDARLGYSGYSIMDRGVFKYDDLKDLSWSISALHFIKRYQLFTSLAVHRFIQQDHGVRFELFRFFNEFQFGLWGVYADAGVNGGFQFSLPLPPPRYKPRGYFRPRIAGYFDLEYYGVYDTTVGTTLKANEIMDDIFLRHHPHYLKSNLGRAEAP